MSATAFGAALAPPPYRATVFFEAHADGSVEYRCYDEHGRETRGRMLRSRFQQRARFWSAHGYDLHATELRGDRGDRR